jgi:hypothetical protein
VNEGRKSSCFRSRGFVFTVAATRAFGRGRSPDFVLSLAFQGSEFVLSLAKEGSNPATQKGISTGKGNDPKENVLKHWFLRSV